jgi:hypothetical protein
MTVAEPLILKLKDEEAKQMITPQPFKRAKPVWHEPILHYPSSNTLDLHAG